MQIGGKSPMVCYIRGSTYANKANSMARNIGTAMQAHYIDLDKYPAIIDELVSEEYILSVTLEDTGKFNYYASSDREFGAWWEGNTRTINGVVGRYSLDINGGNPVFRTNAELSNWIGDFPV